ncbi:MAG: CAP domain-containing protein [Oscillospiraceae bacterium]|nr:CAP domain-containing protein [Oscillospiraceae bacterium]
MKKITSILLAVCISVTIAVTTTTESMSAQSTLKGDIDGNDKVTISDALEILKYLAGMESMISPQNPSVWAAARVTGGNHPVIADVLEILKYLAGMENIIGTKPLTHEQQLAAEVVKLVNIERQKAGLDPFVSSNRALNNATQRRARELTIDYNHNRPDGKSAFTVLAEFGLRHAHAAENIAMGRVKPADIVNAWMNSPGHRENILNNEYTQIGVGVAQDSEGMYYWAQLFFTPLG